MTHMHPSLASGRWLGFSLAFQLANVGSEIGRCIRARESQNEEGLSRALDRALELLDLTIQDPKNRERLRELCRLREVVCDFFIGPNEFGSTEATMDNYFLAFGRAAQKERQHSP